QACAGGRDLAVDPAADDPIVLAICGRLVLEHAAPRIFPGNVEHVLGRQGRGEIVDALSLWVRLVVREIRCESGAESAELIAGAICSLLLLALLHLLRRC